MSFQKVNTVEKCQRDRDPVLKGSCGGGGGGGGGVINRLERVKFVENMVWFGMVRFVKARAAMRWLSIRRSLFSSPSPSPTDLDPRLVFHLMKSIAAEGTEAYTVGLIHATDYWKYGIHMDKASHPSDGDDIKMAGGMASVVFNRTSGTRGRG